MRRLCRDEGGGGGAAAGRRRVDQIHDLASDLLSQPESDRFAMLQSNRFPHIGTVGTSLLLLPPPPRVALVCIALLHSRLNRIYNSTRLHHGYDSTRVITCIHIACCKSYVVNERLREVAVTEWSTCPSTLPPKFIAIGTPPKYIRYYCCGGFIEATFRHSLGPGAVRGISPRGRREEVGEPCSPPTISEGVSRRASLSLTPCGNA